MSSPLIELTERTCAKDIVRLLSNSPKRKARLFNGDPVAQLQHEAYADYYQQQRSLIASQSDGKYVASKTGSDTNQIVQQLNANKSHEEILDGLKTSGHHNIDDEAYENTIDLAARLLLMLNVGLVRGEVLPCRYLDWKTGTVKQLLQDHSNKRRH
ncbi:Uu.00g115180.m01.CDS01 [Anthostomella pinea]|uniref:Uu.00g115180.m01.CDS01 n=1 Tax=Anthostomella pinea TaxID=933095 RepID=A0AAI8YGQ0_9PEZI|nr:Uu.00g115180.m01.CDS01 [Anthostomella pinea]